MTGVSHVKVGHSHPTPSGTVAATAIVTVNLEGVTAAVWLYPVPTRFTIRWKVLARSDGVKLSTKFSTVELFLHSCNKSSQLAGNFFKASDVSFIVDGAIIFVKFNLTEAEVDQAKTAYDEEGDLLHS